MGTQHTTGNEGKQIIIDTDGFEKPVELTRVELASPTFGHYKLDLSRVIVVNLDEKEGLIAQNQRFRAGWIAASKENTHLRETLTARNKELAAKDEELRTARNNSFQGTGQRVRNPLDPTTGQPKAAIIVERSLRVILPDGRQFVTNCALPKRVGEPALWLGGIDIGYILELERVEEPSLANPGQPDQGYALAIVGPQRARVSKGFIPIDDIHRMIEQGSFAIGRKQLGADLVIISYPGFDDALLAMLEAEAEAKVATRRATEAAVAREHSERLQLLGTSRAEHGPVLPASAQTGAPVNGHAQRVETTPARPAAIAIQSTRKTDPPPGAKDPDAPVVDLTDDAEQQ